MSVFDTFSFFNELELLDIRLHELDPVVDFFVIVEATQTHQGNPKPLYFEQNKSMFEKFLPKIRHHVINFPETLPLHLAEDQGKYRLNWARERYQRNCIMRGLHDCKPNDIVIISDLDEIPNAEGVRKYDHSMGICFFEMGSFYYFLNTKVGIWTHAKILPYKLLSGTTPSHIRNNITGGTFPNGGGWHYSYMGGADRIVEKFRSFAHEEYNVGNHITAAGINNIIESGLSVHGNPGFNYEIYETFPDYVQQNRKKYEDLGFITTRVKPTQCKT